MKDLEAKISEFERTLRLYCSPLYQRLRPALSHENIELFLKKWEISDSILKQLFQWKDGIVYDSNYSTASFDYTGFGVIASMQDIDDTKNYSDIRNWKKSLIPLISSFGGDFLLYETDKDSPQYGQLLLDSPNLGYVDERPSFFDSIASMFDTISESFEKEIFKYESNEMFLDIDFSRHGDIPRQHNPKSEYWIGY